MKWERHDIGKIPVKSWCAELDPEVFRQVTNLANHPVVVKHVALMPDCHVGYGMPIGGVIACENALIPNAVGVDIGCGMCAVKTNIPAKELRAENIQNAIAFIKRNVPLGEGHSHNDKQKWNGFDAINRIPGGVDKHCWDLAYKNLGTLGGGNHFIEIQEGEDGFVWLMLHSGSRNLGYRIAEYYHHLALDLNQRKKLWIPDKELAYLPADSKEGQQYIEDMQFALEYARENRARIMDSFKMAIMHAVPGTEFTYETNIHHNYASLEEHFGRTLWIHRKGATSAKKGETGIIPGSMGTASYIVEGLGNPESFESCSHGAGRKLGRAEACRVLDKDECERSMHGIVFDGFKPAHGKFGRKAKRGALFDLEEAPQAYKDIEDVISSELDLVKPVVKLFPRGVVKG